ncbi:MAG TPA: Ig-like domain-containing protein, partial [Chitinispirillaceae bacterium]|nr:Ig-like domain-containing protein [Chitinispirillaceae bacterium]
MKKPVITIVKSNVLNDNYEGLTNVAENVEMWYKLSRAVNAASITAKVNDVDAVVRVNIDTIFVKSVKILDAGTSPKVRIKGLDSEGLAIDLLGNNAVDAGKTPDWPSFTIRPEIYPVASNTWGVKGKDDPAKDFQFYDTMWVKFSQALSTDLNDIVWGAGTITADPTSNPNAKAWVNGDTLFVLPDNRVAITYNQTVSFLVKVKTTLGQVSPAFVTFQVKTAELNLFVKATNTKDANGEMRQDFGLRDTVFVVASVPIDSIKSVRSLYGVNSVNGSVQLPDDIANILRSRVRLSSSGDTIFYAPSAKLSSDVVYALDFTVRLKNQPLSASETNKLQISWKTKAGVMISATNVMANITTFRSFKVIGDSLVVTFTKSIDTSYNAPTPFKVNGFVDNVSKTWSSDLKTVTIKNIDTLVARNYAIAQSDMTTNNTDYDKTITFNVTCADGEEKSSLGGENLYVGKMAIKTEYKCALVGSNTVENHTTLAAIANSETHKDTFAVAGNPTLVFSRAIDTNKVKADIINLYQNFIQLRKTTLPLEFAISFSSDAKTVTINPVANLAYSTEYNIVITNIPVVGLKDAFSGTGGASSILTAYDFKTVNPSPVFLTGKATTIFVDSQSTTLRYAYTPVNTEYGAGTVAAGNFKVKIQKTAWNANYADSVTGYEFRIRNSADGTVWSGWTTLATKAGAGTSYDPLDLQVNGTSRFYQYNIDVATDPSGVNSSLLIPDGGLSYTNNDNMLNKATMVQIIARAYKNNSGANSYAEWSSPVTFSDNVAPGDPDFGRT